MPLRTFYPKFLREQATGKDLRNLQEELKREIYLAEIHESVRHLAAQRNGLEQVEKALRVRSR